MSIVGRAGRGWRTLLVGAVVGATLLLPAVPGSATPGTGPQESSATGAPGGAADKPGADKAPVWTGVPGTNLAHDSYGYPWPAAPDCNEADVAGGCVDDGRGFFQGQCTSWVAFRVSQRNGIAFSNWFGGVHWGNASEWAKVAKGLGYARNRVPAVGAIGWYRRGHVSYVEEVLADGGLVISEMNTDGHNGFHLTTVYPGATGYPDRFLHVADVVPVDLTPPGRPAPLRAEHVERGVSLSWERPADDIGVSGYRVLRNGLPLAETSDTGYVDRRASAGQPYTYTVLARDAAGNVSEPATEQLAQTVSVTDRRRGTLREATEVTAGSRTAVCGLAGSPRRQHVACRVRSRDGWRTLRTGREVPWGVAGSRAFVSSRRDHRVWFCRELAGGRGACLPLDLTTRSWGFDRIDRPRRVPAYDTWVATRDGAARCGLVADRPSCTVLAADGWKNPRRAAGARPGDPLSRAFVEVADGAAFCRVVEGRATCTTLDARRLAWEPSVGVGRKVAHGRWSSRRVGPTLCPVGPVPCRTVSRTVDAAPAPARRPSPARP